MAVVSVWSRAETRTTELRSEFLELRKEVRSDIGELRTEIGGLRTEVRSEMGELRSDIKSLERLIVTALVGGVTPLAKEGNATVADQAA